jgi:hypothetical protein
MVENRGLKTRTAISNSVKTELYNWLKEYSENTGIPVSKLLDKSIELFKVCRMMTGFLTFINIFASVPAKSSETNNKS